jgi:hypothetical protein
MARTSLYKESVFCHVRCRWLCDLGCASISISILRSWRQSWIAAGHGCRPYLDLVLRSGLDSLHHDAGHPNGLASWGTDRAIAVPTNVLAFRMVVRGPGIGPVLA